MIISNRCNFYGKRTDPETVEKMQQELHLKRIHIINNEFIRQFENIKELNHYIEHVSIFDYQRLFKVLYTHKHLLNQADDTGKTVLFSAIKVKNHWAIIFLINDFRSWCDHDKRHSINSSHALHQIVKTGDLPFINWILKEGPWPMSQLHEVHNSNNQTPIEYIYYLRDRSTSLEVKTKYTEIGRSLRNIN